MFGMRDWGTSPKNECTLDLPLKQACRTELPSGNVLHECRAGWLYVADAVDMRFTIGIRPLRGTLVLCLHHTPTAVVASAQLERALHVV
jgi:hypothetical protein